MNQLKIGDKVRATTSCSGTTAGEEYTITSYSNGGLIIRSDEKRGMYCDCVDFWERVPETHQFKKGDLVKIIKRLPGNTFGESRGCYEPDGFVGRVGYVSRAFYGDGSIQVWSEREGKGKYLGIFTPEELEFVAVQVLPTCSVYKGNYKILSRDYSSLTPFIKYQPTNKPIMKTLTTMMQKLLDAPTQTLVKAGYINGDLELTNEGNNALMAILFVANKDALVADAQTKLDAEKK